MNKIKGIGHTFRIGVLKDAEGWRTITKKITPEEAIVYFCRECMGFSKTEPEKCGAIHCSLYPFRMAIDLDEIDSGKEGKHIFNQSTVDLITGKGLPMSDTDNTQEVSNTQEVDNTQTASNAQQLRREQLKKKIRERAKERQVKTASKEQQKERKSRENRKKKVKKEIPTI